MHVAGVAARGRIGHDVAAVEAVAVARAGSRVAARSSRTNRRPTARDVAPVQVVAGVSGSRPRRATRRAPRGESARLRRVTSSAERHGVRALHRAPRPAQQDERAPLQADTRPPARTIRARACRRRCACRGARARASGCPLPAAGTAITSSCALTSSSRSSSSTGLPRSSRSVRPRPDRCTPRQRANPVVPFLVGHLVAVGIEPDDVLGFGLMHGAPAEETCGGGTADACCAARSRAR